MAPQIACTSFWRQRSLRHHHPQHPSQKKLALYGVSKHALKWFKCYLSGRFSYCEIGGKRSTLKEIIQGVFQGSILGPNLYAIYINCIVALEDQHTKIALYADDMLNMGPNYVIFMNEYWIPCWLQSVNILIRNLEGEAKFTNQVVTRIYLFKFSCTNRSISW